ncbi:MAG: class I SAM-dependent RNA methyltransferase [Desulfovibrio sp.]|nr:class I SAM-dependent RNA methyltransferase [Desulfovibrio sp.]
MTQNAQETLTLQVTDLAHDGRGIAHLHDSRGERGLTVFVTGALPDQLVRARVLRRKKSYLEAIVQEVLRPAPKTMAPLCPHHLHCGGCPLQVMPYPQQLHYKRLWALNALTRIGGLDTQQVGTLFAPLLPSPALTRYRNKMEFAFGGGPGASLTLGLRRRNGRDVLAVPGCVLMPQTAQDMVAMLRELAARSGLAPHMAQSDMSASRMHCADRRSPAHSRPRSTSKASGFWRFFILRCGLRPGTERPGWWGICLTSPGSRRERATVLAAGRELMAAFPDLVAFVHEERASRDALTSGERRIATLGADGHICPQAARLLQPLYGTTFSLDVASFFQVNTAAAQDLACCAQRMLADHDEDHRPARLLDVFCGVGVFGLLAAKLYEEVLGLELNPRAVQEARRNASAMGLEHCRYIVGDVADVLSKPLPWQDAACGQAFSSPDARTWRLDVLADPPRNGLSPHVLTGLLNLAADRILYISCNPSTLARDARCLAQAYTLTSLGGVDLFPHTPHVECLSLWRRKRSPSSI